MAPKPVKIKKVKGSSATWASYGVTMRTLQSCIHRLMRKEGHDGEEDTEVKTWHGERGRGGRCTEGTGGSAYLALLVIARRRRAAKTWAPES